MRTCAARESARIDRRLGKRQVRTEEQRLSSKKTRLIVKKNWAAVEAKRVFVCSFKILEWEVVGDYR